MSKFLDTAFDDEIKERLGLFEKNFKSDMHYKATFSGDLMSFEWVDEIENALPFIDNIVRHPKVTLVREELTVKTEKSKKITVASVKDLSRHTNYIEKIDDKTHDVQPSKILDIRNEETYNIYENRFLYTLLNDMNRFVLKKESQLDDFVMQDNKVLEFASSTTTNKEKVEIEVRITAEGLPKEVSDKKLEDEINNVRERIKRIKEYINSWMRSELVKALEKEHVSFINPPIKPTNTIKKNPNFQVSVNLWGFLQRFDYQDKDDDNGSGGVENDGDDKLLEFLKQGFLVDYLVLDAISKLKRDQRDKLNRYAVVMATEQIDRTLMLLQSCGVDVSKDELLGMISKELSKPKAARLVGVEDVKKKFKSAMDEYLERTQDYL